MTPSMSELYQVQGLLLFLEMLSGQPMVLDLSTTEILPTGILEQADPFQIGFS
jgi:hypothetical protein